MCKDCKDYFTVLAQNQNRTIIVSDPNYVRIFKPDGSIEEILDNGE